METKVKLVSALGEREFGISHAQRILDYERSKGFTNWKLSPTDGFELHDGIIKRANKRAGKKAEKQSEPRSGDQS